jgi:hypothetical protein
MICPPSAGPPSVGRGAGHGAGHGEYGGPRRAPLPIATGRAAAGPRPLDPDALGWAKLRCELQCKAALRSPRRVESLVEARGCRAQTAAGNARPGIPRSREEVHRATMQAPDSGYLGTSNQPLDIHTGKV